jgi:hypothetical protein
VIVAHVTNPAWVKYVGQYTGVMTQFCPLFVAFANFLPWVFLEGLPQLEFPPLLHIVTQVWLPRIVLPTLTRLADLEDERPGLCARRLAEAFGPSLKEVAESPEFTAEDQKVARKLMANLCQLAVVMDIPTATALFALAMEIHEPKLVLTMVAVVDVKGFDLLREVFPLVLPHRATYGAELSEMLLAVYRKCEDPTRFAELSGVTRENFAVFKSKILQVKADKTRRKVFREFLMSLQ